MNSDSDANPYQELIDRLNQAKGRVEVFSGLGSSTPNIDNLRAIEEKIVGKGRLPKFLGNTALKWHLSQAALETAIEEKIEAAGTPLKGLLRDAGKIIDERKVFARQHQRMFLPGQALPRGPSVLDLNEEVRINLHGDEPRSVSWKTLDKNAGELREALNDLNLALRTCKTACLETGRAFAFSSGEFGPELILPSQWQNRTIPRGDMRFLLKVEFAFLLAVEKSGPWSHADVDSVELAIQALELAYEHFGPNKKLLKKDAIPVFVDLFDVASDAFKNTVWKDAEIPRWRGRGRPAAGTTICKCDLRDLLEEINKTGEVSFK